MGELPYFAWECKRELDRYSLPTVSIEMRDEKSYYCEDCDWTINTTDGYSIEEATKQTIDHHSEFGHEVALFSD
jgi:transposase-like protein